LVWLIGDSTGPVFVTGARPVWFALDEKCTMAAFSATYDKPRPLPIVTFVHEEGSDMPIPHEIMLFDMAPHIVELFRNDPRVSELIDPAVVLDAYEQDCEARLHERLELTELMSGQQLLHGDAINAPPSENASILVLVIDQTGASTYRVPDPRTHPEEWPWMGWGADEA
jgi:hypothetical protein